MSNKNQKSENNNADKDIKKSEDEKIENPINNSIIQKDTKSKKIKKILQVFGTIVGLFAIFGVIYNYYDAIKTNEQMEEQIILLKEIAKKQQRQFNVIHNVIDKDEHLINKDSLLNETDSLNNDVTEMIEEIENYLMSIQIEDSKSGNPVSDVQLLITGNGFIDTLYTNSRGMSTLKINKNKVSKIFSRVDIVATHPEYRHTSINRRIHNCSIDIKLSRKQ